MLVTGIWTCLESDVKVLENCNTFDKGSAISTHSVKEKRIHTTGRRRLHRSWDDIRAEGETGAALHSHRLPFGFRKKETLLKFVVMKGTATRYEQRHASRRNQ